MTRLVSSLLSLCVFLLSVPFSSSIFASASDGASSSTGSGSPSLISSVPQQGYPAFQWLISVSPPPVPSPTSDFLFEFETIETIDPVVGYVDFHFSINGQALSNFRMVNSSSPFFFSLPVTLESSDVIQFNFTYLSLQTGTAENTYTYSYSPSYNPPSILQVTVVPVPVPSTRVASPVQTSSSNFHWQVLMQRYSNMNRLYTVFWQTDVAQNVDWVNLHYIITSAANVDGGLQNYRMAKNTTLGTNGNGQYYWDVELQVNEKIKFNFTYWDHTLDSAVDTLAFLWTPNSNVVNYISNINDNNVDVNPNGGTGIYLSSTASNGGQEGSTEGQSANATGSGSGANSPTLDLSSSTGVYVNNAQGTGTGTGARSGNTHPSHPNGAVGRLSSGLWMGISCIFSVLVAALMI